MFRILFRAFFLILLPGTALAEDACTRFDGMWQPLYHETYETFPAMRPYMDGPNPAEDSWIKDIIEARRIVIDCKAKSIQSIQGLEASEPRPFNIDSVNEHTLTINFIAERFNAPRSDLEQGLAEYSQEGAPRVVFTLNGSALEMASSLESFVMRRAAPFQMK
jgi:hypothetical protein